MAVHTYVSNEQLDVFLADYQLGRILAFKAIAEGVENSNYFLQTEQGSFILTLYEKRVRETDLPFFLGLMNHLAEKGLRVATALPRRDGTHYGHVANRAAAVISFLTGRWQTNPSITDCTRLGAALGAVHLAAADFEGARENMMGINHWQKLMEACKGLAPKKQQMLAQEIEYMRGLWPHELPHGIIHGDLFPDNALFDGAQLGMIDFYFSCEEVLAYDLAICLNAWCWKGGWDKTKAAGLIDGYQQTRALSATEMAALPTLCRGAAMRFLLTRLADQLDFQSQNNIVKPKNPDEYMDLLHFHQKGGNIL